MNDLNPNPPDVNANPASSSGSSSACPACGPDAPMVESRCLKCGGESLSPAELGALAERNGVSATTLRDVVAAGADSPVSCTVCAVPMKRAKLVDATFDACARCGAAFIGEGVRKKLVDGAPGPAAPPGPSRAIGTTSRSGERSIDDGPIGRALAGLGVDMAHDARWRMAAAPIGALLFASALSRVVLASPLFAAGPWIVFSVLAPAPAALIARTIAPRSRPMAWGVAVLVAGLALITGGIAPLSIAAALGGVVLAATVLASKERRPSWGRIAIATAGCVAAVFAVVKAKEAWGEKLAEGCPPGAAWVERAGRICMTPDGKRHGPGELVGSAGHVLERGTWKMGKRDGSFTFFHDDGTRRAEGLFVDDKEHGPWLFYREGGANALEESGAFVNGKREAEWLVYDDAGKKSGRAWYARGLKVEPEAK